jgi:hypothetical protein
MFVLTSALILTFSPGEKGQRLDDFWFANKLLANPFAGNCKDAEMTKPSP